MALGHHPARVWGGRQARRQQSGAAGCRRQRGTHLDVECELRGACSGGARGHGMSACEDQDRGRLRLGGAASWHGAGQPPAAQPAQRHPSITQPAGFVHTNLAEAALTRPAAAAPTKRVAAAPRKPAGAAPTCGCQVSHVVGRFHGAQVAVQECVWHRLVQRLDHRRACGCRAREGSNIKLQEWRPPWGR